MEYEKGVITFIDAGLLTIQKKTDSDALHETKKQIDGLIARFEPETLSIEKLYFMKNQKTAMQVAQARGVIISAATERGLDILEFGPNEIKLGITGYGLSDKKAVLKMVRLILNEPRLDVIDDASDALAAAITACRKRLG